MFEDAEVKELAERQGLVAMAAERIAVADDPAGKEGILVFAGAALGDLEAAVAADREERVRRLAGVRSR